MKFLTVLLAVIMMSALFVSGFFPRYEFINAVYSIGFASATGLQAIVFMALVKRGKSEEAAA
jgi:hypothetical protein